MLLATIPTTNIAWKLRFLPPPSILSCSIPLCARFIPPVSQRQKCKEQDKRTHLPDPRRASSITTSSTPTPSSPTVSAHGQSGVCHINQSSVSAINFIPPNPKRQTEEEVEEEVTHPAHDSCVKLFAPYSSFKTPSTSHGTHASTPSNSVLRNGQICLVP